jgi:5-methylcytosine-specific restriction enzyme A
VTPADYKSALSVASPTFTDLQRLILEALLDAGPKGMTAGQLARLLGCKDPVAINGAFGRLAHEIYDHMGEHPDGLQQGEFQWWHVVATGRESPQGWYWSLRPALVVALNELGFQVSVVQQLPEEMQASVGLLEGAVHKVLVNAYERRPIARRLCLETHGYACTVCHFDFGATYGPAAANYIHVHHLVPLAEIGEEYEVDPVRDLIPVCPNCHAVIHLHTPPLSVQEVKEMLAPTR